MRINSITELLTLRSLRLCGCLSVLLLGGCVDRRIVITSDPSGADVFLNDSPVGRTPVEVNFTYFGTYDVRLRKDGYEPLVTTAKTDAPIHEWPGIDMLFLVMPFTKETNIAWHFEMQPSDNDPAAAMQRAAELRDMLGPVNHGDTETRSQEGEMQQE